MCAFLVSSPRRAALAAALSAFATGVLPSTAAVSGTSAPSLGGRLTAATLELPTSMGATSLEGTTTYPRWLSGTWRIRNRIRAFSTPLGRGAVDPFTLASAAQDLAEHEELHYLLRWEPGKTDPTRCVQDRAFNGAQETAAFLGAGGGSVTRSNFEISPQHPHGVLRVEVADPPGAVGAATTSVQISIECAQSEEGAGAFVTSELLAQRVSQPDVKLAGLRPAEEESSSFAVSRGESSFAETITSFEWPHVDERGAETVRARNRIAAYAPAAARSSGAQQPRAESGAVTFYDYDWVLTRVNSLTT